MKDNKRPITIETIEIIRKKLEGLPERSTTRPNTKRAMVDALRPEIEAAVDRGYTYAQIAGMLAEKDAPIAPGTLQLYMREAGVTRRRGSGKKKVLRTPAKTR